LEWALVRITACSAKPDVIEIIKAKGHLLRDKGNPFHGSLPDQIFRETETDVTLHPERVGQDFEGIGAL
jgi:hypothetical protein